MQQALDNSTDIDAQSKIKMMNFFRSALCSTTYYTSLHSGLLNLLQDQVEHVFLFYSSGTLPFFWWLEMSWKIQIMEYPLSQELANQQQRKQLDFLSWGSFMNMIICILHSILQNHIGLRWTSHHSSLLKLSLKIRFYIFYEWQSLDLSMKKVISHTSTCA